MHLVTVAPSIPSPNTGGGGNWNASLIKQFLKMGHRVTHVAVIGKHESIIADAGAIAGYRRLGGDVVIVPYCRRPSRKRSVVRNLRTVLSPSFEDLWPDEANTRPQVLQTIEKLSPDCVLPFAFDAVLYTHGLRCAPRVGVQAEGPHINTYVNWRYSPDVTPGISLRYLSYTLKSFVIAAIQQKAYVQLTAGLSIAAFAGAHYLRWARQKHLNNAVFVTTPVPDPVGERWRDLRRTFSRGPKCRILMIGHLHSTSNKAGLPILFEQVLPQLERSLGAENFEIHIVGRNDAMPKRFDRWRDHPSLVFKGPIYPADDEFLACDILLVTVPAKTGSRVRILNGFTYGCCVVAHSANALGIPELVHE
ncbi:MAG TPA: hypothetical protein VGK77_26315, partial [Candidatus Binatia bacterium]